jgi:hypothetical protein
MRSSTAVDWSSPTIRRPTISAGDLCYRAGRSAGSAGLSAGKGEALGGRADVPTKMVELRFLVKVSLPVEAGNAAAKKDGFKVIQTILEQRLQQMHLSDPEIP